MEGIQELQGVADALLLEEAAHPVDEVIRPVVPVGRAVSRGGIEVALTHWRPTSGKFGLQLRGRQPGGVSFYTSAGGVRLVQRPPVLDTGRL